MRKKPLFMVLAILLMGASLSVSSSQQKAPVLSRVTIVPPDPSLPDEVKSLSGTWAGEWNSKQGWDCVLYVEKVDQDSARVVHAFGEYTTSNGNCHCDPDWRRVRRAKVEYAEGKATIEFVTRPYRPPQGPNPSHMVSGSVEGAPRYGMKGNSGQYTFSFTVDKSNPNIMNGHFISAQASHLRIEMKRVD